MEELENQPCPICGKNACTLREEEMDIPYFGKVFVFGIECNSCKFKKSDVEISERSEPAKWTFEVENDEDLNVRIIKSSEAVLKIPRIFEMTPGPDSEGFVSNVEGVILMVKKIIESSIEGEEDKEIKKKGWTMIKKLNKVLVGREKLKIILEDPSGNSAIISEKTVKSKL
ncbi:ZPR1 zinc finger domain-containing protein [Pseudomonadota bacterium]